MIHHALDLEELIEEHSVSSFTVAGSLEIEYAVYMQHGIHSAPSSAAQLANRLRGAQHLRALTNTFALPGGTSDFSLQSIDSAQG